MKQGDDRIPITSGSIKPLTCSVIIPCYNSESFILDLLTSIANQKRCVDEIIVIDDGSQDRTIDVIRLFKISERTRIKRFDIIDVQINTGVSNVMNLALAQVTSDVVFLTGHDDIWSQERVHDAMLHHEQGVELFHSDMETFGSKQSLLRSINEPIELRCGLLTGNKIFAPTVSIRMTPSIRRSLWFNANYDLAEDYELWTRILLQIDSVAHSHKPLINYRLHGASVSSQKAIEQKRIAEIIRRSYCSRIFPDLPVSLSADIGRLFGGSSAIPRPLNEREVTTLRFALAQIRRHVAPPLIKQVRELISLRMEGALSAQLTPHP